MNEPYAYLQPQEPTPEELEAAEWGQQLTAALDMLDRKLGRPLTSKEANECGEYARSLGYVPDFGKSHLEQFKAKEADGFAKRDLMAEQLEDIKAGRDFEVDENGHARNPDAEKTEWDHELEKAAEEWAGSDERIDE